MIVEQRLPSYPISISIRLQPLSLCSIQEQRMTRPRMPFLEVCQMLKLNVFQFDGTILWPIFASTENPFNGFLGRARVK